MLRVAFDIDDTLGYMFGSMIEYFNKKFNAYHTPVTFHEHLRTQNYPYTTDPLAFVYGLPVGEVAQIFINHSDEILGNCNPYMEALERVRKHEKDGDEIFYITARNGKWYDMTEKWLILHSFPNGKLIHEHNKADLAVQLGIDVFYEDNLKNALAIASKGVKVYIIDSIANYHPESSAFERIKWQK